ncbi:MAG: hypothetical protein DRI75_05920 [Bacteroidetes bacterium]|nr:MAG: hypothetical protein DRI75_05920 [Bacteroidota bacterium]
MKGKIFKLTYIASFITSLLISINCGAQEIDVSNYRMLYNFSTVKQHDNSRVLEVSFIARNKKSKKDKIPVFDAEIDFFNILNDKEVLLGTSKTSKEGIAQLTLPENQSYLTDEEGYFNFKAVFEGTAGLDGEEEELAIKDIFIELYLSEIDSVKTVLVKAFTIDSLRVETPVEEVDIIISIGGMLSKMTLEEGYIENGEYEFEFPTDIPGDVNGDLTVYSIIDDHKEFGNVNKKETINWGVFHKQDKKENNKLWSDAAPIWMYVVLTFMLVGVWANYIYTIINLFKIKKEGVNLELESKV